jgi:hypothetical protein
MMSQAHNKGSRVHMYQASARQSAGALYMYMLGLLAVLLMLWSCCGEGVTGVDTTPRRMKAKRAQRRARREPGRGL